MFQCKADGQAETPVPLRLSVSLVQLTQQVFNKYIDYLKVGKNASPYTIRTYQSALIGNSIRGSQKGFFPFLQELKIDDMEKVTLKKQEL